MKPISDWTDAELSAEHDAASYFAEGSYDPETIRGANARITEIENEWDRRQQRPAHS
jgi:hypothetical protein